MQPIIGLAGWSGAGKTTLLERVIPILRRRGLSVSVLKHAHHDFDIDRPGKDSHRQRQAGATQVLVASATRWALMHELRDQPEPDLADLLQQMQRVDLIIIEGYKRHPHAKLEVHRHANGKPWIYPQDPHIVALATDTPPPADCPHPVVHLDDADALANLLVTQARPWATT